MNTQQIIETAEEKLIHTYNRYQIVLDKGDGVRLYDTDGKEYLDFGAGIAVFALGYNNKEYNDALKAQIDKLIHTSNYFYNEPAVEAATALTKASGMDRVFFTNLRNTPFLPTRCSCPIYSSIVRGRSLSAKGADMIRVVL